MPATMLTDEEADETRRKLDEGWRGPVPIPWLYWLLDDRDKRRKPGPATASPSSSSDTRRTLPYVGHQLTNSLEALSQTGRLCGGTSGGPRPKRLPRSKAAGEWPESNRRTLLTAQSVPKVVVESLVRKSARRARCHTGLRGRTDCDQEATCTQRQ
jgi:hypothetical protein